MHNEQLTLILIFIAYLVPQAMIINGIFLSASGYTETLPDGTQKDSEMILYPLAKYLSQHTIQKIYYQGEQFNELIQNIFNSYPTLNGNTVGLTDDQKFLWLKQKYLIEQLFKVKVEITDLVRIYKEYPVYRFSKYIRKPIFGCVICMSSFWGIFLFLIPGLIVFHFDPLIAALYIPNTLCLAFLNYKIFKPL